MLSKTRVVQLLVMIVVFMALVTWRTLNADPSEKQPATAEKISAAVENSAQNTAEVLRCDYFTPCEFVSEHGSFWLSVDNPPIQAEEWINFNLKSANPDWQVTDAKIVGKDMFMGRIPVTFNPLKKGLFSAKTLVGSCITEMIWQLEINIEMNGVKQVLLFDFAVKGIG
ncbi:hypothetical protein [Psychromonas ossibalaenae]|uniref:hypothetical protein n=1 Tax=Psychromonas ossibalaenae TaxID=444922 RepID=UPI0003A0A13D|nr:hypothetical protein [Psychromonas ossibalaenae]